MQSLRQLFLGYQSQQKALPAFNIDCFEIYQAIEEAVRQTNLPCIVQTSTSEDQFLQAERLFLLVKKAQADSLPIYLNYDHGRDLARLEKLARLGFDMLHFDGSTIDYPTNLALVKNFKTKFNFPLLEAEFNFINLTDHQPLINSLTNPAQALEFVTQSEADLLAVSVGNLHGVDPHLPETLNLDLLAQIHQLLPQTFLTLHGGSGINPSQISSAIKLGVVKININTDLRLAFRSALKKSFAQINSEKIYEFFTPVVSDLVALITQKLIQFSAG